MSRSGRAGEAHITAFDDAGRESGPLTLAVPADGAVHFNSNDLEDGNPAKGLTGPVGSGAGDWRLEIASDTDIDVLAYVRAADGFLTAMHDAVPAAGNRHEVAVLNPGTNRNQVSSLRLVNPTDGAASVTIRGIDDLGALGGEVRIAIAAQGARTFTAQELESGSGLSGALGDGAGKWRLEVVASAPIIAMSLLESPTGHLTNLSTAPSTESGSAAAGYRDLISDPIVQAKCVNCHVAGGEAASTRLNFVPDSVADHEAVNLQVFRDFVAVVDDGADLILSKILGEADHGGGVQVAAGSTDYKNMARFLARLGREAVFCQHDRDVLEALYRTAGGDGWTNNEGWLDADDLADWHGTDADGDCVTAIRLRGNRLSGTLPWELGSLAMLGHLDLSRGGCHVDDECTLHALMGEISWELGSLAKLELLDLSGHGYASRDGGTLARMDGQGLTGPIPVELGNLTNLRALRLNANALLGPIPVELANMRNLTELYLNSNELSGPIPTEMGNLTNLVRLSLKHNTLSGPIPLELARLTRLAHLALLDNRLSGPIPAELGNLTSLGSLWLDDNDLWGPIPAELGNLTSLRSLLLRYNELSGPIPVEIGNLTNLARLDLGGNALSGPIPVEIGNLTNLVQLLLDRNELSGGVPVELAGLVKLGSLALNRNRLAGQLPSAMTSLTELESFWFAVNDGLCAPRDDDFQAWLRGIRDRDDGPTCE